MTPAASIQSQGIVDGHAVMIGSLSYVSGGSNPERWSHALLRRSNYEGASAVFVGIDGMIAGALQMADNVRLEAPRALRLLRKSGIARLVMLTGDRSGEIFRLARLLRQLATDLPPEGPDPAIVRDLRRLLYGLDAIVRLHCARDPVYFSGATLN